MNASTFHCQIGTTDPTCPLGLEIWLDADRIYATDHVTVTQLVEATVQDDDQPHELRIIVKNKLPEHTVIDDTGAIIKDACLIIRNICFDDIELNHLFAENSVYRHNYNGTGAWTDDEFFETLGCNGTVTFKFTTPIYLWLLEHM
jgi:hypothetical protein